MPTTIAPTEARSTLHAPACPIVKLAPLELLPELPPPLVEVLPVAVPLDTLSELPDSAANPMAAGSYRKEV
jgi:hypothetical protein